jgi:hypothetical protein
MPFKQKFVYSWPENVEPVLFYDWINRLPESEKKDFYEAEQRQCAYRAEKINEGKMYIDQDYSYVWMNSESTQKPYDETWRLFFMRYLKETKTIFTIEEEEC